MPARAILIWPRDHLIGHIVALAVRFEDGGVLLSLIIGLRGPLCFPDMSWRHLSSSGQLPGSKVLESAENTTSTENAESAILSFPILFNFSRSFFSICQVINWAELDFLHCNICLVAPISYYAAILGWS